MKPAPKADEKEPRIFSELLQGELEASEQILEDA